MTLESSQKVTTTHPLDPGISITYMYLNMYGERAQFKLNITNVLAQDRR